MLARGTTTQQPGVLSTLLHLLQHAAVQQAAKASRFWREKHVFQLLLNQLNVPSAARAPRSAEARVQRHICPWRVLLEWQRTAFSWETLPRDHPQSLVHLLMYFKHRLARSYFCKTNKAHAALGWMVSTK